MTEFVKQEFFSTPIWRTELPQYVKDLNKVCDEYIKTSQKVSKEVIKQRSKQLKNHSIKDKGFVYHSTTLMHDERLQNFVNLCALKSNDFMIDCGFDTSKHDVTITEMWVQEFSKSGGGHHSPHVHWNQHVSGFYFLKCSPRTSYPVFHDPRPGALMTKLPQINPINISNANEAVNFQVKPGTMILIPGYLTHEYVQDLGLDPFRFIHWNIQFLPRTEISAKINV